jgi:membrane protein implicated in regulation of membrane protease activity
MAAYWIWWIAAAALIAVELLTGTFYLLVVGLAVPCGGIDALYGAPVPIQWLIAGVLGVIGTVWLQRWKRSIAAKTPQQPSLDIGAQVQVLTRSRRTARRPSRQHLGRGARGARHARGRDHVHHRVARVVLILAERRPGVPETEFMRRKC